MPREMDFGPNKHMLAVSRRVAENPLYCLISSLPSRTRAVAETDRPLQPVQSDLQVRKPTT